MGVNALRRIEPPLPHVVDPRFAHEGSERGQLSAGTKARILGNIDISFDERAKGVVMVHRIANLIGAGGTAGGYVVPDWMVGPGFVVDNIETPYRVNFASEFDFSVNALIYVDTAVRIAEAGYAAVLVNTVGDYGVRQMQAALKIPVIGAGQAALQMATTLGRRFGIVTVFPSSLRSLYVRILRDYELEDRCVGVWYATEDSEIDNLLGEGGQVTEMRAGRGNLIDRVEVAGKKAIAAGADVIVQGCTCMSPVRNEMAQRLSKPVLDPLAIAQKTAEMMVTLGLRHADPALPATAIDALHAMIGGKPIPKVDLAPECGDSCEILQKSVA